MNKLEFLRKFAEDNNTTYILAEEWGNAFFDQLKKEIVDNSRLEIRGLGVFTHKKYKGRVVRSFKDGTRRQLEGTTGVKFKLSDTLTREMRELHPNN